MIPRADWSTSKVVAFIWYCGDEDCDCTEARIERITPNREAGYPWIRRETLWSAGFMTDTWQYSAEDREREQYAPLRAACAEFGVPVPEEVRG